MAETTSRHGLRHRSPAPRACASRWAVTLLCLAPALSACASSSAAAPRAPSPAAVRPDGGTRTAEPSAPVGPAPEHSTDAAEKPPAEASPHVPRARALATRFVDDPTLALVVTRRVKTGVLPKSVATSPDGATLWVCNFGYEGRKNVYVYDSTTLARVGLVEFRGNAVEVAFAHDGLHAYVSNFARGVVEVVDTRSFEVLREVQVGVHPKVIVPADDGRVFVANWTSGTVSVVDPERGRVVARLDGGKRPRGMAMTSTGTLVVDAMWDHELRTFSQATLDARRSHDESASSATPPTKTSQSRRGASLPKTPPDTRLETCRFPRHTLIDDHDTVFVTCSGEDTLRWFALDDGRVLGEVRVGDNPRTFAMTDDGRYAAVANFDASSVTLVDLVEGRAYTTPIPGTDRLVGLSVAKGEALRVFVTSWGNNELVELTLAE